MRKDRENSLYSCVGTPARAKAHFESILKSIREVINSWKGRDLTLTGEMQVLKFLLFRNF